MIATENWKRRTEIVDYCVNVMDQSMSQKHQALDGLEGDAKSKRKTQAELFADEVKVRSKPFSLPSITAADGLAFSGTKCAMNYRLKR